MIRTSGVNSKTETGRGANRYPSSWESEERVKYPSPVRCRSYAVVRDNQSGSYQSGNHSRVSSNPKYTDISYSEAKNPNNERSIAIMRNSNAEPNESGHSSAKYEKSLNDRSPNDKSTNDKGSEFDVITPAKKAFGIPSPADDLVFAFTSQHIAKANKGKPANKQSDETRADKKQSSISARHSRRDGSIPPPVPHSRKSSGTTRQSRSRLSRSKDPNAETLDSYSLQPRSTTSKGSKRSGGGLDPNAETLDSSTLQPRSRVAGSADGGSEHRSERMSLMSRSHRTEDGTSVLGLDENDYYVLPESKEERKLKGRQVLNLFSLNDMQTDIS